VGDTFSGLVFLGREGLILLGEEIAGRLPEYGTREADHVVQSIISNGSLLLPDNPRQVAEALRKWATEHNLLRGGLTPSFFTEFDTRTLPMSSEAASILEKQAITAFGINDKRRTVYVYTNKRMTKAQASMLPPNLYSSVSIEYRQARPIVVGNEEEDPIIGTLPYYISDGRYTCGSSIGVGNARAAGTLGALVRDRNGGLFGLTNNHVTGGCNNTRQGLPILAPGVMDVTDSVRSPFTIGWHDSVLTLRQGEPTAIDHKENTDAALLKICDERAVTSQS
jgi:hypothetical protein